MNLQVELIENSEVHCFKVIGEIDAFTAPVLKERLVAVQGIEGLQAEINLSEVDYIDSTGLGVFIGFFKAIQAHEGSMKITGANARLKRLFEITGLDQIIDMEVKEGGNCDATV